MTLQTNRRNLMRGTAWAVPVITVASAAPAFATSSVDPITGLAEAIKCPGKSTDYENSVVVAFNTRSQDDAEALAALSLGAWTITVNREIWDVKRTTRLGTTIYAVTVPRGNSANGVGTLVVTYTLGNPPQEFVGSFAFTGTHPDHDICGRV